MAINDSAWSDFENVGEQGIQEPPTDDGVYACRCEVGDDPESKNGGYLNLVVEQPEKWKGFTIVKFMTYPEVMRELGKIAGMNLALKTFKSAIVSAGVDIKTVMAVKEKGRAGDYARLKLLNNKKCHVLLTPAVLTRNGDYADVAFVDEATFKARVEDNGKRMAGLAQQARPAARTNGGKAAEPAADADLGSLDDLD